LIVAALEQTGNPGAAGNVHPGVMAHFSLPLGPECATLHPITITTMAAAACAMAIERLTPQRPAIGWPGDILLQGIPVARIMVDTPMVQGQSSAVASIAVNICKSDAQDGLLDDSGSLNAPYLSPGRLAGEIAREFMGFVRQSGNRDYMEFYRDRSTALEQEICYTIDGEARSGRVMGVDDDGALIVLSKNGTPDRLDHAVRLD
jgi:biotin-(acetyl-CoA carboxylase) ligase